MWHLYWRSLWLHWIRWNYWRVLWLHWCLWWRVNWLHWVRDVCWEGLVAALGLVEDLVVALGLVHVLEDLVEVAGWECAVGNLYLEGFVGLEGIGPVPGLQVLLPLMVQMEDLALEGFLKFSSFCLVSCFCLISYFGSFSLRCWRDFWCRQPFFYDMVLCDSVFVSCSTYSNDLKSLFPFLKLYLLQELFLHYSIYYSNLSLYLFAMTSLSYKHTYKCVWGISLSLSIH